MIEILVREFLEKQLSVPVYMEMPEKPEERFVVLKKGGSSRENMVDTAMFVADSYAETLLEAAKLNEQVMAVLDSLIELDDVSCSERSNHYPLTDTKNKRYRYQAVQNISHY